MNKLMVATASLLLLGFSSKALAKPIVVAIIDTGIDTKLMNRSYICPTGSKDFSGNGLDDTHGHGTHISGIIHQYAGGVVLGEHPTKADLDAFSKSKANYCQIVLKYFSAFASGAVNLKNETDAIEYATSLNVDVINISAGGPNYDSRESIAIKNALNKGIKVVVAAGNDHHDISIKEYNYFPANYDKRLIIVGNLSQQGSRSPSSNFGPVVNTWEHGEGVFSTIPGGKYGRLTGTSQATAIKTGKLIYQMLHH